MKSNEMPEADIEAWKIDRWTDRMMDKKTRQTNGQSDFTGDTKLSKQDVQSQTDRKQMGLKILNIVT